MEASALEASVHERETLRPEAPATTLVVPAADAVSRFRDVLGAERDAARRADTSALVALQEMKRQALDEVRAASPTPEVWDELAELARANLELMRHLVSCLRGIVGEPGTYGATARVQVDDTGRDHGAA